MDHYQTLKVPRSATPEEIQKAYRRLAIKYHPQTHPDNVEYCTKKFAEIAEAYEVLSDDKWRAVYEQYGDEGIKSGICGRRNVSPFKPRSPLEIYESFFGTANPHEVQLVPTPEELRADPQPLGEAPTPAALQVRMRVPLEELYSGSERRVAYVRRGPAGAKEERSVTVRIERGWPDGTRLTFRGEGDYSADGRSRGDLVVVIDEAPHNRFKRKGRDLHYTANVTLAEALLGSVVNVQTLDGRSVRIPVHEIASPRLRKIVAHEGMPAPPGAGGEEGNLVLEFEIGFPERLSDHQRELIRTALVEEKHA
eukprot:m51a1_g3484 putative chaperon Hsp40 (309) ;mRNA; r:779890-780947